MRQLAIAFVTALAVFLSACGSGNSNNASNVNGNWTASLTDPNGNPVFSLTTSLTQNSDNSLTVANLNFTTATPCFGAGTTATGGIVASGNFSGVVNSAFTLSIQSGQPGTSGNNVLNLQGTVANGNAITGTWVLTGTTSGCTGSGNFTMTRI